MINIFSKEEVFKEDYTKDELYLLYIKNIAEKFMKTCANVNKLEYNFPGSNKITYSLLKKFIKSAKFRQQGKNPIKPIHYLVAVYKITRSLS